jgi:hypothetical protein
MPTSQDNSAVDTFAEWLRRRGYQVVRTASSYWADFGPRTYQAFPYHWVIRPSEEEIKEILYGRKVIALRYSTPVSEPLGCMSYHVVYDKPTYHINRDYAAVLGMALEKWLWGSLSPSKISQAVLFSKSILLSGGKIAQLGAGSQFSPDFGHTNPSATRCYQAGKPICPRPAPPGNGEPGERPRRYAHTTAGRGKKPWPPL